MAGSIEVTFVCSSCGEYLACHQSLAGSQIRCPSCDAAILVSPASAEPPALTDTGPMTVPTSSPALSAKKASPITATWRKALVPLGVLIVFFGKFKVLLLPVLKFFPLFLKTGGTMLL